MKQLQKDKICFWCFGCNRLEEENFEGTRNCKDFLPAKENWQIEYYKKLGGNNKGYK